jgi:2-polyprenyl-3-methyl-5-hydroxy-6-metoxy-1,4-benzoquinol methylase
VKTVEPDITELLSYFAAHGGTDFDYLKYHLPRFVDTKRRFTAGWDRSRGTAVLDIGAHWLHQSILYARDGFAVTAVDLPLTLDIGYVRAQAEENGIRLISEPDLAHAKAFDAIGDSSIDIVLFTEIIEHITFNPVALWKQVYRVLKPAGRIVVTTPNYYAATGRAWNPRRFLSGFGGGLDVLGILNSNTYAHHWKEFSRRELIYYFCVLSPDFNTVKADFVDGFAPPAPGNSFVSVWLERNVSRLKPNLYLEVELTSKDAGIVVEPSW